MVFELPRINALSALDDNKLFVGFEFFELIEMMRHKEDKLFIEALNNLAKSEMTKEQVAGWTQEKLKKKMFLKML